MNVNELLDTIEDTLEESAGMPLSGGKRIVDVEQIRDYLDEIRQNLPVDCLLYTSPSPRDTERSRMPSSA